jgi:hypothetical protein
MHVHVLLWLDLMFQGSIFRSGTHTFLLFLYNVCDSPNRQNARQLNMSPFLSHCEWFLNMRQSSVPTTQIHPFERGCILSGGPDFHHKCLLEVVVEMTQDVTVKKVMSRSSGVHQLSEPSVSLCH